MDSSTKGTELKDTFLNGVDDAIYNIIEHGSYLELKALASVNTGLRASVSRLLESYAKIIRKKLPINPGVPNQVLVEIYFHLNNGNTYNPRGVVFRKTNLPSGIEELVWTKDNNSVTLNRRSNKKPKSDKWIQNGQLHRVDGPAERHWDREGTVVLERWFNNGQRDREDGPAVVKRYKDYASIEWHKNGELHNDHGPALMGKFHTDNRGLLITDEREKGYEDRYGSSWLVHVGTGDLEYVSKWYLNGEEQYSLWNELPSFIRDPIQRRLYW